MKWIETQNNIIADNSMCAALKNLLNFTPPDLTDFAPIKFLVVVAPF